MSTEVLDLSLEGVGTALRYERDVSIDSQTTKASMR